MTIYITEEVKQDFEKYLDEVIDTDFLGKPLTRRSVEEVNGRKSSIIEFAAGHNAAQKRYTKTTAIQPITSMLDQSFMDALARDEHLDCNAKTSKTTMLFSCFKCKEQITALDSCGTGSTWHLYKCSRCQQLHITGNPPKEAISEETVLVQL